MLTIRRPQIVAATLAAASLLALSGCGNDGADAGEATPSPSAAPTAHATSSPSNATVSRSAASPASPASPTSPPAPARTTSTTPDGVVYGYLKANTATTLTFDKVDLRKDNCEPPDASDLVAAARFCFSNTSTRLRTVALAADVSIVTYDGQGGTGRPTRAELSSIYGTQDDETPPAAEVFKLIVEKGRVISIEQFPIGVLP